VRRIAVFCALAVLVVVVWDGALLAEPPGVPSAFVATRRAVPTDPIASDMIVLYEARQLDASVANAAIAAAMQAGGAGLVIDSGEIGLYAVMRGTRAVQVAPPGMRYPMSTDVIPPELAGRTMSRQVARVLATGQLVMGATSATLRGAKAGDIVVVQGWNGNTYRFRVGLVASDDLIGGSELLISPAVAQSIGFSRPSDVVIWGFRSRAAINAALAAHGLVKTTIRIRRSWDPPDPDVLLTQAQLKVKGGEFAYSGSGFGITLQPGWIASHISHVALGLGITANCHNVVIPALRSALAEVAADHLAGAIDVSNTNHFGGCFNPEEISALGSTTGGFVSRHTWGWAIDMNTIENPEGAPPTMNCSVVRIFRKWGFAWGGNFLQGDGMHFEYVGERRDQLPYPSRFCPNIVSPSSGFSLGMTARSQLFAPNM